MTIDPRTAAIKKNLEKFDAFVAVMSSKGGVGKTFSVAVLAYILANNYDVTVSLLDMDLTNPTLHMVLGLDMKSIKIEEEKGIKPFKVSAKTELMTMAYFVQESSIPLRGKEIENAVREILSITKWNGDILFIDMPPGFSDSHLEFLRLFTLSKTLIILITTPQLLALKSVEKLANSLLQERAPITGIMGNMCMDMSETEKIRKMATQLNLDYLGCIPYIADIENYYGSRLAEIIHRIEPSIKRAVEVIAKRGKR
ncbi:MAG: P-loop NTPase [Ignisphaera sp.]